MYVTADYSFQKKKIHQTPDPYYSLSSNRTLEIFPTRNGKQHGNENIPHKLQYLNKINFPKYI